MNCGFEWEKEQAKENKNHTDREEERWTKIEKFNDKLYQNVSKINEYVKTK